MNVIIYLCKDYIGPCSLKRAPEIQRISFGHIWVWVDEAIPNAAASEWRDDSLILPTIRDDTWNLLNMQHITQIRKDGIIHTYPVVATKFRAQKSPAFLCEWSLRRVSYCDALCPDIGGSKQMNRIGLDISLWKSKTYFV